MGKIVPFLWFDDNAEEAVNLYTSLFEDSKIIDTQRYGPAGPGPEGSLMTATFQIAGQEVMALNGGPHFKFNEAFSFFVNCETQDEIDRLWNKLLEDGGQESQCGWLKDKFGLSWQIVPTVLGELLASPDAEKSRRVMEAMLKMVKLDIDTLKNA